MLNGGTVSFEDGRKAAEEYAPNKKASATISFSAENGEDFNAILDQAIALAQGKVYEMLGVRVSTGAPRKAAPKGPMTATEVKDREAAMVAPTGATILEPLADATLKMLDDIPMGDGPKQVSTGDDAMIEEPAKAPPTEAGPIVITDADLYKAITTTNAALKKAGKKSAPADITKLIEKHCPKNGVPASSKLIPEAARPAFLADLKALAEA